MADKLINTKSFNPERERRKNTGEMIALGLVSLLISAAIFWAGIKNFPLTAALPAASGADAKELDWSILGSLTSLATLSLVVGGLVFAFVEHVQNAVQQRRESAEASFNIYREVFDRLMSPQALEARRWIIVNLPTLESAGNDKKVWLSKIKSAVNKKPGGWKGDRAPGKDYIKDALNTFDFIGFVAKHYWNMENELVMWLSSPIAKVWERIHLYVEEEAEQRSEPDYYQSAREFGDYCVAWREKHHPRSTIIDNGT